MSLFIKVFILFAVCSSSFYMTFADLHKRCDGGQVYVSNETVSSTESFRLDPHSFCCPINRQKFQYSEPSSDKKFLECCTGAIKPIYDTRYQMCVRAQILPIPDLGSARYSKHRSPFQNIYYFQPVSCSKILPSNHKKEAKGPLLIPANSGMTDGSESFVFNFTVIGPIRCQRNTWFALPSPKFLNSVTNVIKVGRKKDLLRVCKGMGKFLDTYLETLSGTTAVTSF